MQDQPTQSDAPPGDDSRFTVVLTGGGTGGHITPLIVVARELKARYPQCEIVYIGERRGKFAHMIEDEQVFDKKYTIFAGKFRRYHGESWLKRLLDVKTNFQNIRDVVFIALGFLQSLRLLKHIQPDVILLKGGFVGVPVGLAAALKGRPFVTHDSDVLPGLANRLVSKWAAYHATGMPAELYAYPPDKTKYVGVLVAREYQPVTQENQDKFKQELGLPDEARLLFVTGGSLGARRLNEAMRGIVPALLSEFSDLHIIHQVGKGNEGTYGDYAHERLQVLDFVQGMYRYSGAADVIVTRAGANTIAEFGVQGKACIVVPNPQLTGGHQTKNAEGWAAQGAVVMVDEATFRQGGEALDRAIRNLLQDTAARQALGQKLRVLTVPDATARLATLLVEVARGREAGK